MTNEIFLYIGIAGLVVSILFALYPHAIDGFQKLSGLMQKTKIFQRYITSIQLLILAQGASALQCKTYQTDHLRFFWLLIFGALYISLYTQDILFLSVLPLYPYYLYQKQLRKRTQRNKAISRSFPYFLDILILCLESGMDCMRAIKEMTVTQKRDPLHEELAWIIQSTQVGHPLSASILNAAQRTKSSELFLLAESIAQSAELGSSLSSILRLQSASLREKIFKQAQAQAQKAPVKMLFPLIFCIFPVVFIVLFVPIAVNLFAMM